MRNRRRRAAKRRRTEHAGEDRADDAADAVDAEHVERIVGTQMALERIDAPEAGETAGAPIAIAPPTRRCRTPA